VCSGIDLDFARSGRVRGGGGGGVGGGRGEEEGEEGEEGKTASYCFYSPNTTKFFGVLA